VNRSFLVVVLGVLAATGCRPASSMTTGAPVESVATAPLLLNAEQIEEAIAAEYPEQLRADGVGGTVRLRLFVDTEGVPEEVRLLDSSGYPQLDAAASRVAIFLRFSPAINGAGEPISVWVSFPISFRVR
jgi:protein TonB